jgi:hypothetical protein
MKAFIIACSTAVIIAIIGGVVLGTLQQPVENAFATSAVRLGR